MVLNLRIVFFLRNFILIYFFIVVISRIFLWFIGNICCYSKVFFCFKKFFVFLKFYLWVEMEIWFLYLKIYMIRLYIFCMCNFNIFEFGIIFNFLINRIWFVWIMCNYCLFLCIFVCVIIYNLLYIWYLYERRKGEFFLVF